MRKYLSRGFTLVELLIVIALIGVIATIVIAAINPIEQANRARDAGYKADASQLLSAEERYFASHSEFPWVTLAGSTMVTNDSSFGFINGADSSVGVCVNAACSTSTAVPGGLLVTALELKTEFLNRNFVKKGLGTPDVTQEIFVGKAAGSSSSVYACFVPQSKSNRDTACTSGSVYTLNADGTRTAVTCTAASTWPTSPSVGTAWVICEPD